MIQSSEPVGRLVQTVDGKNQILDLIQTTLTSQHTINGVPDRMDERDQALLMAAIVEVIKRFAFINLEELRYVFKRGLTGDYDEMNHFFNAKNVNIWIKTYIERERSGNAKLIAQRRQEQPDNKPEPSPSEREKLRQKVWIVFYEWIDKQHQRYKEAKLGGLEFKFSDIDDHPAARYYYKRMIEGGFMEVPGKEEKIQAVEAYKLKAIHDLKSDRSGGMVTQDAPEVQERAKSLAMMHFIKRQLFNLFENDTDLRAHFLGESNI